MSMTLDDKPIHKIAQKAASEIKPRHCATLNSVAYINGLNGKAYSKNPNKLHFTTALSTINLFKRTTTSSDDARVLQTSDGAEKCWMKSAGDEKEKLYFILISSFERARAANRALYKKRRIKSDPRLWKFKYLSPSEDFFMAINGYVWGLHKGNSVCGAQSHFEMEQYRFSGMTCELLTI